MQLDSMGRPLNKTCECGAELRRYIMQCPHCRHEFVGKNRGRVAIRSCPHCHTGCIPRGATVCPVCEASFLPPVESEPRTTPPTVEFTTRHTKNGGLQLIWPTLNHTVTLSPTERLIVKATV